MFANARMYSTSPPVAQAWNALLAWVIARAEVECEILDYPAPLPLPAMWERPDMGCALMCGYPFAIARPQPILLAVPVPGSEGTGGTPVYWTDILVRSDTSFGKLTDLFGHRFAYTTEDSQSGYLSALTLLAPYAQERGGRLFSDVVGPLVTPRRVIEALLDGTADAGPVDSYALELVRIHEPAVAHRLHILASTRPIPAPPLVAAAGTPPETVERLRQALLDSGDAPELSPVFAALCLNGFVWVPSHRYDVLAASPRAAEALGYPRLA